VTAATNNGPLFDLREEAGGFAGSGNGFFAAPVAEGPWKVHLTWDLSAAPAGSRGVWSLGEGTVDTVVPSEVLQFSYYYVGPIHSYPAKADPHFSFYWLSQPPFDPNALGDKMRALYGSMAKFFDDETGSYRVFVRQNPFKGTGGTGLARSFTFGYNYEAKPTVDGLQGLLAHEMAHTWPALQGEHGDTAWYSEGTAEYYSTVLSYRAGAISVDKVLKTFNDRADAYYSNPYVAYTNPEAAKVFWTDPVAQTVPYGRGWLYLQQTDAAIRAASKGRRSLDDVVKEIRRRQVANKPYGIPVWLELVGQEIGPAVAKASYDHMVSGGLLKPPPGLYAPCLMVVSHPDRPFQLGFARASLNDDRLVRDLVPGSAAEQAGVRNGDVIVETSDINEVRRDEALSLTLTLRRGETQTTVSYLPRGAPVEGYRFARDPKVPDAACRF
jgi:predicted metalloprotease with PDZ domain